MASYTHYLTRTEPYGELSVDFGIIMGVKLAWILFLILFNYALDWLRQKAPTDNLGRAISPQDDDGDSANASNCSVVVC